MNTVYLQSFILLIVQFGTKFGGRFHALKNCKSQKEVVMF